MAQAILHNITHVAKCCILVRLDSSMVGYDDWDGPFVLPTRTRDIRGFGLDFSERLGREPGEEETKSIGISERDDFDKTVCMYHHRNAILVLTLEHTHVISAINHSLSSLTRMVLVLHHRKTLRSFEFRPSPPRDLISNESYLGGGVSSLRRPPPDLGGLHPPPPRVRRPPSPSPGRRFSRRSRRPAARRDPGASADGPPTGAPHRPTAFVRPPSFGGRARTSRPIVGGGARGGGGTVFIAQSSPLPLLPNSLFRSSIVSYL
jgi:hypothetical protein